MPAPRARCVEHLGRGALRLVLEAVARHDAARPSAARLDVAQRSVGVEEQRRHSRRVSASASSQRVAAPPALQHDPGRRPQREQRVGGRRGARAAHSSATRASKRSLAPGPAASRRARARLRAPGVARRRRASPLPLAPSSCAVSTTRRTACSKPRRIALRPRRGPGLPRAASARRRSASSAASRLSCPAACGDGGPSDAASVCVVSMRGIQPPRGAKARARGAQQLRERQRARPRRAARPAARAPIRCCVPQLAGPESPAGVHSRPDGLSLSLRVGVDAGAVEAGLVSESLCLVARLRAVQLRGPANEQRTDQTRLRRFVRQRRAEVRQAGAGRLLGRVVRPVQDDRADPRRGRRRTTTAGCRSPR